ncbi:MAG: hypothetical protein AB1644_02050 [Candidatus Zixiibacteriota bacterium]
MKTVVAALVGFLWLGANSPFGIDSVEAGVTATPAAGELAKIILNISPNQIVGAPFRTGAEIILLDSANNLQTDYDLAAQPIWLVPDRGQLDPDTLSNPALIDSGIIDFLPASVRFWGRTGQVAIYATNGTIRSSSVTVTVSGYDILAGLDHVGAPISQIFTGNPTSVRVVVQNKGNLIPNSPATIRASFRSSATQSTAQFTPASLGELDTITVTLPTAGLTPGPDTLVLQAEAVFPVNGASETTIDEKLLPVTILTSVTLAPVAGTFQPDSVYAGVDFPLSYDIAAPNFDGPIDSSSTIVELVDPATTLPVATIRQGPASASSFNNGVIAYGALVGRIDSALALVSQSYAIRLSHRVLSGGSVLSVTTILQDSLFLLRRNPLAYVTGTLAPSQVAAGAEAVFSFDLVFSGTVPVEIQPGSSVFTLTTSGFSSSVSMSAAFTQLVAGVNHVQTAPVFIPPSLLGQNLAVLLTFNYRRSASPSYLNFLTTFNNQLVPVGELPVVQILQVSSLAPNVPKVNTGQHFQISCLLANLTAAPSDSVDLRLATTGASTFTPLLTVPSVPANDTVELLFSVTAAQTEDPAEIFRVDIVSPDVSQLPPVDNVALMTVERPASLALTYTVVGGSAGYFTYGETFSLTVTLSNFGRSGISPGRYRLTTGGADLGSPDSLEGSIDARQPVGFIFHAPFQDLSTTINFTVIEQPLDSNTLQPAPLQGPVFNLPVMVVSTQGDLLLTVSDQAPGTVIVGAETRLLRLHLANRGQSSATAVRVHELTFRMSDIEGRPVEVGQIVNPTLSGLFANGTKVASASAQDSLLTFTFTDFIIPEQQTSTLDLRAFILALAPRGFGLRLDTGAVDIRFVEGPRADSAVKVVGAAGGPDLVSAQFATAVADFASSFVVQDNPYRPREGPARFSYVLTDPTGVLLRVFSLQGEQVYEITIPEGNGASGVGTHVIEWDGRNGSGHAVLNGVYIVSLTALRSGVESRLKLAVVK